MNTHGHLPSSLTTTNDLPTLNSYGSVPRVHDIDVLPTTTVEPSTYDENHHSPSQYRPRRTPFLKPHQSETVFALCLFTLGLSLLIYVIVSYWVIHSPISPAIIFICGLLCFIPGCYYLLEHYCFCLRCSQRNRLRRIPIHDRDDIV